MVKAIYKQRVLYTLLLIIYTKFIDLTVKKFERALLCGIKYKCGMPASDDSRPDAADKKLQFIHIRRLMPVFCAAFNWFSALYGRIS